MLNEKQEKFAQKFVLSGNATQSAKDAGYSKTSAKVTGHKLVNNSKVLQRIEELKSELTTSYDVVQELEDQYAYAKSHGHTNSALKALEMLSRIRGNTATNVEMSEEAIHAGIVSNFYVLGREKVMKLMDEAEALGSQAVTRMISHK